MSHVDALAAGAASVGAPAPTSTGTIIGAAIGGALLVVVVLAVAIRAKIVSAQLNAAPTISAWTPGQKKRKVRVPDMDVGLNTTLRANPAFSIRSLRSPPV